MQLLFGDGFRATVELQPINAAELALAASSEASERIQRGDPRAVVTWMQRLTRVRPALELFGDAMMFLEATSSADPLDLRVAQMPFTARRGAKPG